MQSANLLIIDIVRARNNVSTYLERASLTFSHVNSLHGGKESIWRMEYAASLILGDTETL